jgi:hypothetical protein
MASMLGCSVLFPDQDKSVYLFDIGGGKVDAAALGTVDPGFKIQSRPQTPGWYCHDSPHEILFTLHISDAEKTCCLDSGKFTFCDFWPVPLLYVVKTPSVAIAVSVPAAVPEQVASANAAE